MLISLILPLLFLTACQSQEVIDRTQLQKNRIEQAKADQELLQDQDWHEAEMVRYKQFTTALGIFFLISAVGLSAGIVIFAIGGSYYKVQALAVKAGLVYSNENGQFPINIVRGAGYQITHDPNLQLEPSHTMLLPSATQKVQGLRHPELPMPQPEIKQLTDGRYQMKVTTQAQYHKMMQSIKIDPALRRMHQKGMLQTVVESTKELETPEVVQELPPPAIVKPERTFNLVDETGVRQLT